MDTKLFATEPAKVRPGYANFAVADPALKPVLVEDAKAPRSLNHLGVEVGKVASVAATSPLKSGTTSIVATPCGQGYRHRGPAGSSTPYWLTPRCQRARAGSESETPACATSVSDADNRSSACCSWP